MPDELTQAKYFASRIGFLAKLQTSVRSGLLVAFRVDAWLPYRRCPMPAKALSVIMHVPNALLIYPRLDELQPFENEEQVALHSGQRGRESLKLSILLDELLKVRSRRVHLDASSFIIEWLLGLTVVREISEQE